LRPRLWHRRLFGKHHGVPNREILLRGTHSNRPIHRA
jgi:hypothetical protein